MTHADKIAALHYLAMIAATVWLVFFLAAGWRKRLNWRAELASSGASGLAAVAMGLVIWLVPTTTSAVKSGSWLVLSMQVGMGVIPFVYLQFKSTRYPDWTFERDNAYRWFIVGWTVLLTTIRVIVFAGMHQL